MLYHPIPYGRVNLTPKISHDFAIESTAERSIDLPLQICPQERGLDAFLNCGGIAQSHLARVFAAKFVPGCCLDGGCW